MAELNARIIAKASGTASEEPLAADLEVAELAVNTADGKLFTKHTDGSVVTISGGSGGAVDSVNGQTGVVVLDLNDIGDVNSEISAGGSAFETGFEVGEPYPQDPTSTADTTIFYEGSQSISFSAAQGYGDGSYLDNVFPNVSGPRYDVVRLYIRSDQAFTASNRQGIGGTKSTLASTGGWTIYTRDTGFVFYGDSTFHEAGIKPSMVADTWYEVVYIIDWANGRGVVPARWSLWVDGAIAVDSADPGSNGVIYTPTTSTLETRFYWTTTGTGNATRWADKLSVKSSNSIPWGMSQPLIDEVNDVNPFFAGSSALTPDGHVLRYDSNAQEWQTVDFSFESLPQAGYNLFDSGGDPTQPYSSFTPTALGQMIFTAHTVPEEERWSTYADLSYGPAFGRYHLDEASGGTITDARLRDNEARRSFYAAEGILHNLGDKPIWLTGALGTAYSDNTPELRWTSGNPVAGEAGNYVGLKLSANTAQDITYTMPQQVDGGKYLRTDESGRLTWDTPVNPNSPGYTYSPTFVFNYENNGEDFVAIDPALLSTLEPKVGSSNLEINASQSDAQSVKGLWPVSAFGDENFIGIRPFTFQTWFRNKNPGLPGDLTKYHRMISTDASTINVANGFQIRINGGATDAEGPQGALELSSGIDIIRGGTVVTDQNWHHLVIQHDGEGNYWMFLDGVLDKFKALGYPYEFKNYDGFVLGGRTDDAAETFWMGSMDATEILVGVAMYDTGGFTPPTSPAGDEVSVVDQTQIRLAVISDVSDVDTATTPPVDGDILQWNNTDGEWQPAQLPDATTTRNLLGIGEYADDAAAGTGGVASGAMYYNTTSSDYRLKS